ncbi:MAG: FtsX-like permease family protein [Acidobacteria bacterium]|nr:FtsX-like permease family protein [Acidobacteriota bacterium]
MAYRVVRRTREIGIRIAVGARQQSVVWMMVRETLLLVTIGATLGTLGSLAADRYVAGQLFGVTPRDPVAIRGRSVGAGDRHDGGCYLLARQASRIDPVKALRAE